MILPDGFTTTEIRFLQEFRFRATDRLDTAAINNIRHPAEPESSPAEALVAKGYVVADGEDAFVLTEKAKAFLAYEPKP